jgi:hypothetical protein
VFAAVVDRVCFKALQLLRRVQWGLLALTGPSLKQLQQSFHPLILRHHSLGPLGNGIPDVIRLQID